MAEDHVPIVSPATDSTETLPHGFEQPMGDSFQDVYARHLQHPDYGYPLRVPEPMSTLPEHYQNNGLEIGDVGTVDPDGQFEVLFNICKNRGNVLHGPHHEIPENFEPLPPIDEKHTKHVRNAIPTGPILSHGITRINESRSADYEFGTSTSAGAILLLPHGAESTKLTSQERFRKVAVDRALDWYEFAKKRHEVQQLDRTLYLITGFHKARSWSFCSFNNPTGAAGKVWAKQDKAYQLEPSFRADCRQSPSGNCHNNQTVFVTGFSITVSSWFQDPVVLKVTEAETTWSKLVRLMTAPLKWFFLGSHKPPAVTSVNSVPSSQSSQPFHPSDRINRLLLNKNLNAKVAITHDTQWMDMMKQGLEPDDFLQEDSLETFLTRYDIVVDSEQENATVFLRIKSDDTEGSVPPSTACSHRTGPSVVDLDDSSSSESEMSDSSTSELDASAPPTPTSEHKSPPLSTSSLDNPLIVITRIRAQNIPFGCKRIPIGFYVLVQFDGTRKRTQNKPIRLNDSDIEWDDVISLPSQAFDMVRFTIYASFELNPMLGNGEVLYTSEVHLEELNGGTYLIMFPHGESEIAAGSRPSLLITLGRWHSIPLAVVPGSNDCNLVWGEPELDFVHETNMGQEALLHYYNEYQKEDLESAVRYFECARCKCPSTHPYFAVVLVNLARARSIIYQADPTSAKFDALVLLYQEALNLRRPGHPDRPATLLQFAQVLLFCYEKQGHAESVANEINKLSSEFRGFPEDTHERRAADLVLTTLQRCKVVSSGSLAELDELVQKLTSDVRGHRDDYFDKPQRLINLSATLWRRYEKYGILGDLDQLSVICGHGLQLLPTRHPDRLLYLRTLSAILWKHFMARRTICDLRKLIGIGQEALQLIPEGHPEYSYWVSVTEPVQCISGVYQPLHHAH